MKPTKPALNSYRKLISRKSFKDIGKGSEMGRVIIPVSEQDNSIRLPEVENTTTYSILKTEEMQGNLEIVNDSIKGSFKGMLFNKSGATLSIVPISVPTQSFTLNSTSTNGASVSFLSDGADWFIWGMMADGAVDAKATGDFGDKKEGQIDNNVSAKTDEILVEQGLGTENPDPAVVAEIEESTQTETPAPVYPPDAPTLAEGEGYLSDGETTNSNSWVVGGTDVLPGSTITVTIYDSLNVEETSETITVGEDGTWTSTTDTSLWSDDTYTVSIIITNPNTGLPSAPTEITVTRDATPPVITISEASPYGFEVGNAGPTAPSATADDGSTVTNDWNETTLNALAEGQTATITYTATDAAGNVGTATLTVEAQASSSLLSLSTLFDNASYDSATDVVTLDGSGDYATFDGDFRFTDRISISAWFKTSAAGDRRIISAHVRAGNPLRNGFLIYVDNGTLKFFEPSWSSGTFTINLAGPWNDDVWHQVAITWQDGSGWNFYVDGTRELFGTDGSSPASYDANFDLFIGANAWDGNPPYGFFDGQIGKVAVENVFLSDAEVLAIYNEGAPN